MAYTKLTQEQLTELEENWAALPEEEKNKSAQQSLATKFGVSFATIVRKLKSEKSAVRKNAKKVKKAAKAVKSASAGGVFHDAVSRIVDARLDSGLSALRADLPALIEAGMKKLMGL